MATDREKKKDSFAYPNPTNFESITVNIEKGYNGTNALATIHDETGLVFHQALHLIKTNKFVLDALQTLPGKEIMC